jgi:hypothetical protein
MDVGRLSFLKISMLFGTSLALSVHEKGRPVFASLPFESE